MTSVVPRTARGRATRERILAAATELIAARGVAGTSLEDVRLAASASKSQLYLYFTDRDDLLRAVAHETCDRVMDAQAEALASFDTLAGVRVYLERMVARQHELGARGGCPIGTLAGQLAESDAAARGELAAGMGRWQRALSSGLETMAARGDFHDGTDPAVLAAQILAILEGGLLLTQVHRDPLAIRMAADGALALISHALARSSPAP